MSVFVVVVVVDDVVNKPRGKIEIWLKNQRKEQRTVDRQANDEGKHAWRDVTRQVGEGREIGGGGGGHTP